LATALVAQAPPAAAPPQRSAPAAASAYASAAALQDQGLFDLAADEWSALVGAFPDDPLAPRARYNWGVCLFQAKQFAAAAKQFTTVSDPQQHPKLAEDALANRALARLSAMDAATGDKKKGHRAVVAILDRQLKAFPTGERAAEAHFYRGESLWLLGETKLAASAYQQLLRQHADSPMAGDAALALGRLQIEIGQHQQAEKSLSQALSSSKDPLLRGEAHRERGEARLAAQNFDGAAQDFRQAADTPDLPQRDQARNRQAYTLYRAGKHREAMQAYDVLAKNWPESPLAQPAQLSAAKCLVVTGEHDAAAKRLEKIWKQSPTAGNAQAAHWLARSWMALDKWQDALQVVEAALAVQPAAATNSPQGDTTWLAELAMDRADILSHQSSAGAAEAYATVAKRFPTEPIGHRAACQAAHAWLQQGKHREAIDLAQTTLAREIAASLKPDLTQVVAEGHRLQGENQQAAGFYRQLIAGYKGDPRQPLWSLQLARCLHDQSQWPEARAVLDSLPNAKLTDDDLASAALMRARAAQELGSPGDGLAGLSQAIDRRPRADLLVQLLYRRGHLEVQLKKSDGSADFGRIVAEFPESTTASYARFALASGHYDAGQFEASAKLLQPFAKPNAKGPVGRAMFLLASAQQEQGNHAEALEALKLAEAPPAERLYLQGFCQSQLGRIREAQASLQASLQAEGASQVADRALYELAWVQAGEDRQAKADVLFARLVAEHPDSPLAAEANYRLGASLYAQKQYEKAHQRFQAAATAAAKSSAGDAQLAEQALHLAGWAQFDAGQHEAAAKAFARQLREYPQGKLTADAMLMQAECLFAKEQFAAAYEKYREAFSHKTLRADLRPLGLLHAAQTAGQLKKWEQARQLLQAAQPLATGTPHAEQIDYEHAWALHKLQKNDQAAPLFAQLAESTSGQLSARSRFMVGELEFADKKYEQAVRTFFKVAYGYGGDQAPAELHPWQSQALFEAARCLEQLDRNTPARKLYTELLERFPESEKASHARQRLQSLSRQ